MPRIIFLLLSIISLLPNNALARPKIGLVLSGGGARGGAHLGVIKVLEENQIPIDAIVGTSMGALVGGLYASGMDPDAIYNLLTKTRWQDYVTSDYERDRLPFRRKLLERDFPGSLKLGVSVNAKLSPGTGLFRRQMMLQFLQQLTIPVANIHDFDMFPIPFRAVACNLQNGETVSLGTGSLAESIYASISIPGGFEPITINDTMLVDGGISDNLPLDVMRQEMDIDIIIVVDISTPFARDARFTSLLGVLGQLSSILMRRNVNNTILTLRDNEILISPDLGTYTPLDVDKYQEIIKIGADTAAADYGEKLAELSVTAAQYDIYRQKHRNPPRYTPPNIRRIILNNLTFLNDETIMRYLHQHTNQPLDTAKLGRDLLEIYSLGIFEDVKYELIGDNDNTTLKITASPSWDSNGQLKFSFGFEDDFTGKSDYTVRMEYLRFGLNSYGGEWRNRISIGRQKLLFSEFYQPLDLSHFLYLRPDIFYSNTQVYISPTIIADHSIKSGLDDSIPASTTEYGGTIGLGVNFTNDLQFESGVILKDVSPSISVIKVDSTSATYIASTEYQHTVAAYANLTIDSMDRPFFATRGYLGKLRWSRQMVEWGSEMDFSQVSLQGQGVFSLGHHTFMPRLKYGITFATEDFDSSNDLSSFYTLGGLFNLSGLPSNAVSGDHELFSALIYRYQLSERGFFGTLGLPAYSGLSLEAGETWYNEYGNKFSSADIIYAGSVYVALDTFLGPFYLGLGLADTKYWSLYFSLGDTF